MITMVMMMSFLTACQGTQNDAPVEPTDKVETPSPTDKVDPTETPSVPDTNVGDNTEGNEDPTVVPSPTEPVEPSPTPEPTETPTPTPEPTPEPHVHKYSETVIKATCTESGYTKYECTCGDAYKGNETKALGHSFTNYVYNNDATLDRDGSKTAKCDNAGCKETDTWSAPGTRLLPTWTDCNKTMYVNPKYGAAAIMDKVYGGTEIDSVREGIEITVTGTSDESHMCRISWNGKEAYMVYTELSDVNPNPTPTPEPDPEPTPTPEPEKPAPTYTIEDANFEAYAGGRLYIFKNPNKTENTGQYIGKNTRFTITGICNETSAYRVNYNGIVGYVHQDTLKTPEEFPYALNTLYENGDYQMYFYYNADDKSQRKEVAQRAHELLKEKASAMGYTKYMVDEANTVDPNNIIDKYYNIYCITINLTIYE